MGRSSQADDSTIDVVGVLVDRVVGAVRELVDDGRVLEVGCGRAARVLTALRTAGYEVQGTDASAAAVDAARALGHDVARADAAALDHPDRGVDVVVIRHVLHHLTDPARAVAEAWRVARVGIVVAEPWFDVAFTCQRLARRVDEWLKQHDERLGRVHRPNWSPAQIAAWLPSDAAVLTTGTHRIDVPRPRGWLEREAAPRLADLGSGDAAFDELDALLTAVERDGLSWNGTAIVAAQRR